MDVYTDNIKSILGAMKYPRCFTEAETIEAALAGRNLARYGDGEFSIMTGGNCISQVFDPKLAFELQDVLSSKNARTLPCLPTPFGGTPKKDAWLKFTDKKYMRYIEVGRIYGSAFITRPDSAPWIDTPEYWFRASDLWRGRDVTLVLGSMRSLRPDVLREEASSVREVWGPRRDAYAELNRIVEEIGRPNGPVILCLGPAATVLADRLAKKDIWAIDLGHMGMFMRHAGAYRYTLDDLSTKEYRNVLEQMHASTKWGDDGASWARHVNEFCERLKAVLILDYGCGQGMLRKEVERKGLRVTEFDVGRPDRRGMPKPVDITVCTDVLEHVEPEKLDNVLEHLFNISAMGVLLNISCRKAKAVLPDGRNAHLIIQPPEWWLGKLKRKGWRYEKEPATKIKNDSLTVWMVRDEEVLYNALGVRP